MRTRIAKVCLSCDNKLTNTKNKYCCTSCQQTYQRNERFARIERGEPAENEHQIKSFLLAKYGNVCMSPDCAWDFAKLSVNVELEHSDGNGHNHTLANCILLCPNCHSRTPTYKAKNKGKGRGSRLSQK